MSSYRQFIQRSPIPGGMQPLNAQWNGKAYMFSPLHVTIDETHYAKKSSSPSAHSHDVYHITIYTEGQNFFQFKGKSCAIHPGTLALTAPGESHNFYVTKRGQAVYSEITFAFADAAGRPLRIPFHQLLSLYEGFEIPDVKVPVRLSAGKTREARAILVETLAQLMTQEPFCKLETAREVLSLFSLIVRECYLPQINIRTPEPNPIRKTCDYIGMNYMKHLKIHELAGIAGMSMGYFLRTFKKQTGWTPITYQQKLRVEAAKTLLRYSHLRCKEIADKTGYEDTCYFSKLFKKIAGLSPMAYRRRKNHKPQ